MLTFFRRVRKGLLDGGSTRKYLVYAIGEIALVVIGILIALQINNLNEEQKRKATIAVYLSNLKKEIANDLGRIQYLKDNHIFRYYSLQHLLKLSNQAPLKLQSDEQMLSNSDNAIWEGPFPEVEDDNFLNLTFLWSSRVGDVFLNTSTMEELKSAGLFSYLGNDLKEALNRYYNQFDWRLGENNNLSAQEDINRLENSLAKSGVMPFDISQVENPLALLSDDAERVAIVKKVIRQARWRANSCEFMEALAIELESLIDKEISRL